MSRIANKLITAASGSGADSAYKINQSLVFDAPSYTGLVMSSGNDGNHRKWTWSGWVKKAENLLTSTSHNNEIFASTSANGQILVQLSFYQDTLYWAEYDAGNRGHFQTNRVFRDPSAWYHIVLVYDSAQGSASDRIKPYINGVRETSFVASVDVPQNYDSSINTASIPLKIGNDYGYIDGSQAQYGYTGNIAEVHYLDGTSYDASYFGETNSDTGQWIPKEYTDGNYGTNGFYLKFVSGAIGTDSSGEGNNFTVTNLANADVVTDTPTNNFCTMNPLALKANHVSSQGNLKMTWADGNAGTDQGTMVMKSGKWYWEIVANSAAGVPLAVGDANFDFKDAENIAATTGGVNAIGYGPAGYIYQTGGSPISDPATFGTSDIAAIAVDVDGGTVKFYKNNSLEYTYTYGTSGVGITPNGNGLVPLVSGSQLTTTLNFGQNGTFSGVRTAQGNADGNGIGDFYYAPPSGYLALCTSNLSAPAIALPSAQFNTVLYTGNGSTNHDITGVGFQPDWVWIKNRSQADSHVLNDAVRGAGKTIYADLGNAEASNEAYFGPFQSDGFRLAPSSIGHAFNASSENYVSWNWKANGAGSSNSDGAISSTVSANQTAGFSIVTFTMPGSGTTTIGHGLGEVPDLIFAKSRGSAAGWITWDKSLTNSQALQLHDSAAVVSSTNIWGAAIPTSSVFGAIVTGVAPASTTAVAYCFVAKDGYSSIGTYTGNGAADGPTIVTGFKPALVITKRTDATGYWGIFDAARAPGNVAAFPALFPNGSDAEVTGTYLDLLSNGFKIRITSTHYNADGGTYLYMAFAESPFKYANAR